MELLRGFEREVNARAAESADAGRGIGFNDADNAQRLFAGEDGDAAWSARAHGGVEKRFVVSVLREGGSLGITQGQIFSQERGRLIGEKFCKFDLQNGFVRGRRGEILAGHALERAARPRGIRQAENRSRFRFACIAHVGDKANLRIDFRHSRKLAQLLADVLVQEAGILFWRGIR